MSNETTTFGNLVVTGKDIAFPTVKYDRLAIGSNNELYLVSLAAATQVIKGIRACLNSGVSSVGINATGGKVKRPSDESWRNRWNPGNLRPAQGGYASYVHRLDFGMAHAMFIARTPGFLPVVSEAALWAELKSTRFTTPLLRAWLPYIEKKLRDQGFLEECPAFNCKSGILKLTTDDLDKIVEGGLANQEILIPTQGGHRDGRSAEAGTHAA